MILKHSGWISVGQKATGAVGLGQLSKLALG